MYSAAFNYNVLFLNSHKENISIKKGEKKEINIWHITGVDKIPSSKALVLFLLSLFLRTPMLICSVLILCKGKKCISKDRMGKS